MRIRCICLIEREVPGKVFGISRKRIGYVSPEMHLYYKENVPTLNIVGSGFFDSIGLFRKCNAEQETVALEWMKVFGIEHLKDRLFLTLSSGESPC